MSVLRTIFWIGLLLVLLGGILWLSRLSGEVLVTVGNTSLTIPLLTFILLLAVVGVCYALFVAFLRWLKGLPGGWLKAKRSRFSRRLGSVWQRAFHVRYGVEKGKLTESLAQLDELLREPSPSDRQAQHNVMCAWVAEGWIHAGGVVEAGRATERVQGVKLRRYLASRLDMMQARRNGRRSDQIQAALSMLRVNATDADAWAIISDSNHLIKASDVIAVLDDGSKGVLNDPPSLLREDLARVTSRAVHEALREDQKTEALRLAQIAVKLAPDDFYVIVAEAKALCASLSLSKALSRFERSCSERPSVLPGLVYLHAYGLSHPSDHGDPADLKSVERIVGQQKDHPQAQLLIAAGSMLVGLWGQAESTLHDHNHRPTAALKWAMMSVVLHYTGQVERVWECCRQMFRAIPDLQDQWNLNDPADALSLIFDLESVLPDSQRKTSYSSFDGLSTQTRVNI